MRLFLIVTISTMERTAKICRKSKAITAMPVPAWQYRYVPITTMILILAETLHVMDGVS